MDEVHYFFVIPALTEEKLTTFQGFHPGLADAESVILFHALCCAPNTPREIFYTYEQLLDSRRGSSFKNATPISAAYIDGIPITHGDDFCIFFCRPIDLDPVIQICKKFKYSPLIVSLTNNEAYNVINLQNHTTPLSQLLDQHISDYLDKTGQPLSKKIRNIYDLKAPFPNRSSGVTLVGELTHHALGFEFTNSEELVASEPGSYIDAMLENAESLFSIINTQAYDGRQEIILYAPSVFIKYNDMSSIYWNQILRKVKLKWHRELIKNGIFKNRHYSGITVEGADENNPYLDPMAGAIIASRQKELLITNLCAAFIATSEFLPAIRLPNSVNLRSKQLKEIEQLSKKENPNLSQKFQQAFRKVTESLLGDIDDRLINYVNTKSGACKILSDAPIEWLYFNKLPLMISHEVSKIPTTPGNMLMQLSFAGQKKYIHKSSLLNILVIRSFKSQDPIKNYLQIATETFPFNHGLAVEIIDVETIEETISALNCYSGAIVIFDCHGDHDGPDGISWLAIGEEKLNTWDLYGLARIPPIVMLSACLTSPISGSHASVANGLLRSGALSVIGTFLPVEATPSAIFMARILFRIDSFLPVLEALDFNAISWRSMISTFLKMSYTTDMLHYFRDDLALINDLQFKEIHLRASENINSLNPDWHEEILEHLAHLTSLAPDHFVDQIKNYHPMMETMNYCQLGRPETLIILTDNKLTPLNNQT
ncbi:CHAT domain-containing protein [Pseudomonas sp. ABY48]|uniref:CHAT domain-containing protein n=1 Tax=Pseudomonas sp. ABY48 TaxID=3402865 RepID=UPI003B429532